MYENKILNEDPRSPLDRASRDELYAFAKANHVTEIDEAMYMGAYAGVRMKKILLRKGLTNINTSNRPLYSADPQPSGLPPQDVDALADLPQKPLEPRADVFDISTASRAELAKECKKRGIKMARTDTKEKLQERLSVQNAA